jgi:hypothetical protein
VKQQWLLIGGGALAALAALYIWRDDIATRYQRGGAGRHLAASAVSGAALDTSLGQRCPDHLLHYGPTMLPPHWTPHRVKYPATPGQELERLMYGAPGSCAVAVPRAQRGWLFAPPSEEDY